MPLSRNHRIDRRRRVMLDAVINDPELAAEHARVSRRNRARARENDEGYEETSAYRDPGYSQAVRKSCQQRIVQLIPVRRGTVAIALTIFWLAYLGLVYCHYLFHHAPLRPKSWNFATLPIASLFDLTAWNSISHWLSCQLWLLTAIACWMTFNLRRHKLDDYRARYRVWAVMGFVALFLHFDAGTSSLLLLGQSIDPWARAEIGYGGWPLVLATTASLVGVMGIRLCSELKTVPTAVLTWVMGLIAVAASALIGTGLLKTSWTPETLRLMSGSLWLAGALAVFQAVVIYLRHTYIQAQKRFLCRRGINLKPIHVGLPKWNRRGNPDDTRQAQSHEATQGLKPRGWKDRLPWMGARDEGDSQEDNWTEEENATQKPKRREEKPPQAKKLFGLLPNRELANEEVEYEPVAVDEGEPVDEGLTKKPGWFGIGGNAAIKEERKRAREEAKEARRLEREEKKTKADTDTATKPKRKLLPSMKPNLARAARVLSPTKVLSKLMRKSKSVADGSEPLAKPKPVAPPKEKKDKRSWLGMLEGLKLKPPTTSDAVSSTNTQKSAVVPKPIDSQTSSPSLRQATVQNAPRPSTQAFQEEFGIERPLSKAERKRLRQQSNDRRAA